MFYDKHSGIDCEYMNPVNQEKHRATLLFWSTAGDGRVFATVLDSITKQVHTVESSLIWIMAFKLLGEVVSVPEGGEKLERTWRSRILDEVDERVDGSPEIDDI